MRRFSVFAALSLTVGETGCAKPDHVMKIESPEKGLFYTVETFKGHGPVDADFIRVYAHLELNGETDRKLVLDGEYLDISKITWVDRDNVKLCLQGGFTNSFHNQVTLRVNGSPSETIHTHLLENCEWE
jgi:hypothetical protein